MTRCWFAVLGGLVAPLFLAGTVDAQVTFTLGFQGPDRFVGRGGDVIETGYLCTLAQDPTDRPGAQGWSISMAADNAEITNITVDGTTARAVCGGAECGFETSQLTTAARPGSACEGKNGAMSAVTLALIKPLTLDPAIVSSIAAISVKMTIAEGTTTAVLKYVDGCRGLGQPVDNVVTREGKSIKPVLGEKVIELVGRPTCAPAAVNLGFSAVRLTSATTAADPLGSVLGDEGMGGQIVTEVNKGATGTTAVYVNIVSNVAADRGPQGWSLAIAIQEGAGGILKDGTVNGTTAAPKPDGLWDAGFEVTALVDPERVPASGPLAGRRQGPGVVSSVVLSLTKPVFLPPKGAESVLKLTVDEAQPQGDDDQTARLYFRDGLVGAGQPVPNVITLAGTSVGACNKDTADVTVVFTLSKVKKFRRGDPNSDGKLNIADPIWIINALFRQGPKGPCLDAADANDNGIVDSSDAVYLINYLFKAGPAPVGPVGECIEDPTPEDLSCEEHTLGCG